MTCCTLSWSNGKSSTFDALLVSPGVGNQFVLELEITAGLWTGATASTNLAAVSSVGDCVSTPVTEADLQSTEPWVLRPAGATP